jgi:hypothetical protein
VTNRLAGLRNWNVGVGLAHLAQAVLLLVIASDFAIPLVSQVQTGPPGSPLTVSATFFEVRFAWVIAAFLLLAAIDHLLMASPWLRPWYERNLLAGWNTARWAEYSVSASLMVVLIGMLTGITDLYAVMGLFAANAAMILFGLIMERVNPEQVRLGGAGGDGGSGASVDWWPFTFGCLVGIVPWVAIVVAFAASSANGGEIPVFVYIIFGTLFVLFNTFALNQWLQYRAKGRFRDYLYGEKVYLVLSLVAKSALAWQVFAGTLAD